MRATQVRFCLPQVGMPRCGVRDWQRSFRPWRDLDIFMTHGFPSVKTLGYLLAGCSNGPATAGSPFRSAPRPD
jgi:hypothetical protein